MRIRGALGLLLIAHLCASPAHAAGARTVESTPIARALDMIARARGGGLVPAASAQNRTRRRPPSSLSPMQLLERAAELASTRPDRARPFLARALHDARAAKQQLPKNEVKALEQALADFATTPPPRVEARDRSFDVLVSKPPAQDAARVRRYARLYAKVQREHNGQRPEEILANQPSYLKGKPIVGEVPYWDVDAADVELMGLADRTPFRAPSGKVRVFSHYLSTREHAALEARFGRGPDGRIPAEMTSSYRTLMIFPEDGATPYMLKFSGHEVTGESKRLSRTDVAMSVERSLQLRRFDRLVPEPAGMHVPGVDNNVLYRPLPMPRKGLRRGDRALTWQVLMSPEFRATPGGQRIFRKHGSYEAWFKAEGAPRIVDVVEESLFDSFAHYEIHSQNLDALVGADGQVREMFVKDLLDMLHDPVMELAVTGKAPRATQALRDREWGNLNEAGSHQEFGNPAGFYEAFASQTGADRNDATSQLELGRQLRARIRTRLGPDAARVDARVGTPGDESLARVVARYRLAILQVKIGDGFRPDPRAKQRFLQSPGKVNGVSRRSSESFRPRFARGVTWGTLNGAPVAITRDAQGQVKEFWFKFE